MGRLLKVDRNNAAKRLVILTLLCCVFLYFPHFISSAETSRKNYLRTSYNPKAYTLFEINGTEVTAVGTYAGDRLRKISVPKDMITSMKFSARQDGSFEASFTLRPANGYSYFILEFESGAKVSYRVNCDASGWYFPENGLSANIRDVFGHIIDLPDEGEAAYFTASGDKERADELRRQIKLISDSVTEGLESDYEKAQALNRYVASTVYYDLDAKIESVTEETVSIENILNTSRTVCIGFANFYSALLQSQGIESVVIKCCAISNDDITYEKLADSNAENHEFTAFWYEEEQRWVWVDPCWSGAGDYENGVYKEGKPHEKYFDISDDALAREHKPLYAERRSFFVSEEQAGETETRPITDTGEATGLPAEETDAPEETAAPEETTVPEDTSAPEETSEQTPLKPGGPEDADKGNVPLIVLAAVLGAGIGALAVYIAVSAKTNRKRKDKTMVVIELENGKQIKLELYPDIAPVTVQNFEELVSRGFYDGLTFHRVIRGFMIQGGCPVGNGTGNSGKHIKGEFSSNGVENSLKHTRGVISMARAADPDSASCQFFIMHEDAPHLDGSYAAFGKVVEGMDAVDEIAACETDYADMPVTPVRMKSVKII